MSTVCIGFVEAGTPETGLWCERCALPSRVEYEVLLITDAGAGSTVGRVSVCTEEGRVR